MDAAVDDEGKLTLWSKNWIKFGRSNCRIFKQCPGLSYLFGALDDLSELSLSSAECVKKPRPKTPK